MRSLSQFLYQEEVIDCMDFEGKNVEFTPHNETGYVLEYCVYCAYIYIYIYIIIVHLCYFDLKTQP